MHVTPSIVQRFWSKVGKDGPLHPVLGTACWIWLAGVRGESGYGAVEVNGRILSAHRFSFFLANPLVPIDGLQIRHRCNIRLCVNPGHLLAGTHAENMKDMAASGINAGENHHNHRLTEEQVVEIRLSFATGKFSQKELADEFGVSAAHVHGIVRGKYWKTSSTTTKE